MNSPVRYMTVTYILSLSFVALLSVFTYVILDAIAVIQHSSAEEINLSGKQRMLSQRSSLFAYDFSLTGSEESLGLASAAIKRMLANHEYLLREHKQALSGGEPSPLSPTLQAMYFKPPLEVDAKIDQFDDAVSRALYSAGQELSEDGNEPEYLELSREPLLVAFDAVVKQYEIEASDQVANMRSYLTLSSVTLIFALISIAMFVFRPMVNRIGSYAKKMEHDASVDFLSGLLNRRAFYMLAERAQLVSKRYSRPTSAILVDIDHFKRVNDNYGHEVGDEAIKYISTQINDFFRTSDIVARFGGEEFVVLLQETNLHKALIVAERLRAHIESSSFTVEGESIILTVSCGVSTSEASDEDAEKIIARADLALYEAKESGRNRVAGKSKADLEKANLDSPVLSMN